MKASLVSIIMPAFNAGKFIGETIESVLSQSLSNWELIIVDDGSTDNTRDIVAYYAAKDARIRYIYQNNGGQGKARNHALSQAKGKFIAFLDADDLWTERKLEIQVEQLLSQPEVVLVFSSGYVFETSVSNCIREFNRSNNRLYEGNEAIKDFINGNRIPILTVLAKKEALSRVGFFDESRFLQNVEDYHLWFKLLYHGFKLKSFDHKLAYYRVHDKQSTNNIVRNVLKEINLLLTVIQYDPELRPLYVHEIKRKYRALFIKQWSEKERNEFLMHYMKNVFTLDKPFIKAMMFLLPGRIFSLYYRRIHLPLFFNLKSTRCD